jgi:hypothetical protein
MNLKTWWFVAVMLGALVVVPLIPCGASAEEAPRITKEEAKALMGSPGVVILDVRAGKDWSASELKVKGAVREDPSDIAKWASKYAPDTTLILYCA